MIRSDFIAASVVAMATVSGLDAFLPDASSRPDFLANVRVQVSAIDATFTIQRDVLHEVVGADVGFVVSDPVSGATICASGRVADFYAAEPRRQVVPLAVIPAKRTGLPACTPDLLRPGLAVRWHARDVLGNYAPAEAQAVVAGG